MNFDNWRLPPQDYDTPPNHDDACMICDRIDCECPAEDELEGNQ